MSFEPVPFQIVSDPKQLKAFTDPLRIRILHLLADREATNQQLAAALGESQAKVLHHVRFLIDTSLIRLVDQRIKGGNVEKYYRSTARIYGFRPQLADVEAFSGPVSGALFESVTQELVASLKLWPDQPINWETRRKRLSGERIAEFNERLLALLAEFWGDLGEPLTEDPDDSLMAIATVTYRFPGEE
ncbi:MAG TPA: ArsR family transcriptional regulator [Thermomicrobiales bacterium]|nr:ArsR family transcriptional regulator [Thermomicrobiales bacterium]